MFCLSLWEESSYEASGASKENPQPWLPLIQPGKQSPCTGGNFSICLLGGDSLGGITTHAAGLIKVPGKGSQAALAAGCLLRGQLAEALQGLKPG